MKIAIVGDMRSGTTVVNESLNQHSQLNLTYECWHSSAEKGNVSWRLNYWPDHLFSRANLNNNNPIYENILDSILQMYDGFKLIYPQLNPHSKLLKLIKNKCRIIHLIRKNKFDIALSMSLVKRNRKWQRRPEESWQDKPIELDSDWLEKQINQSEEWEKEFRNQLPDVLEIQYEDFQKWDQMMFKILDFLGLKKEVLPPTLRKRTISKPQELITNYHQLAHDPRFYKYLKPQKYFL